MRAGAAGRLQKRNAVFAALIVPVDTQAMKATSVIDGCWPVKKRSRGGVDPVEDRGVLNGIGVRCKARAHREKRIHPVSAAAQHARAARL